MPNWCDTHKMHTIDEECPGCEREQERQADCLAACAPFDAPAEDIPALIAALREIVKCESRYAVDPLERAHFAVEHCQQLAQSALARVQERP